MRVGDVLKDALGQMILMLLLILILLPWGGPGLVALLKLLFGALDRVSDFMTMLKG